MAPIQKKLIEPSLMTPADVAWLNAYHRQVGEEEGGEGGRKGGREGGREGEEEEVSECLMTSSLVGAGARHAPAVAQGGQIGHGVSAAGDGADVGRKRMKGGREGGREGGKEGGSKEGGGGESS
jgi:hypothetical protein